MRALTSTLVSERTQIAIQILYRSLNSYFRYKILFSQNSEKINQGFEINQNCKMHFLFYVAEMCFHSGVWWLGLTFFSLFLTYLKSVKWFIQIRSPVKSVVWFDEMYSLIMEPQKNNTLLEQCRILLFCNMPVYLCLEKA